jgi:hypothetical protein
MIENDQQLQITKEQIANFEAALAHVDRLPAIEVDLTLIELGVAAMKEQVKNLREQVAEYDTGVITEGTVDRLAKAYVERWMGDHPAASDAGLAEAAKELVALVRKARWAADDPELDGTDFAHPAFERGQDEAVYHVVRQFESAIDGTDTGGGVLGNAGLERIRRFILEARRDR